MTIKMSGRAGHNKKFPGANGLVNEVTENRKIISCLNYYLNNDKEINFSNNTPESSTSVIQDLRYSINIANAEKVDLYFSIHINTTSKPLINGPVGAECWVYPGNENSLSGCSAKNILKELENLGFLNRGVKYSASYSELHDTTMPAMIIECFFLNSSTDVELYNILGADEIAYAIYKGLKRSIGKNTPLPKKKSHSEGVTKSCSNCANYKPIK